MFVYLETVERIKYTFENGQHLYLNTGSILKVEVISLRLFKVYVSEEKRFVIERSELDIFLEKRIMIIKEKKSIYRDREDMKGLVKA